MESTVCSGRVWGLQEEQGKVRLGLEGVVPSLSASSLVRNLTDVWGEPWWLVGVFLTNIVSRAI